MPQVAVVVSSFDRYSDCWPALAHGFSKYWPDCPYPIHLISNFKDFEHPNLSVLKVGEDTSWSRRLLDALARLDATYVLYFQEDYWITRSVDTQRVKDYAALMEREGLNYIRLLALPVPDGDFPADPRLGRIAFDGEYRTSMQIALWRREVLCDLLVAGESVWQFELDGTVRSRRYGDTFLSVRRRDDDPHYWGIYYVCTAINAGRWARKAKRYADAEGLAIDFSQLPSETWWDDFKRFGRVGPVVKRSEHRIRLLMNDPKTFVRKARLRIVGGRPTR